MSHSAILSAWHTGNKIIELGWEGHDNLESFKVACEGVDNATAVAAIDEAMVDQLLAIEHVIHATEQLADQVIVEQSP